MNHINNLLTDETVIGTFCYGWVDSTAQAAIYTAAEQAGCKYFGVELTDPEINEGKTQALITHTAQWLLINGIDLLFCPTHAKSERQYRRAGNIAMRAAMQAASLTGGPINLFEMHRGSGWRGNWRIDTASRDGYARVPETYTRHSIGAVLTTYSVEAVVAEIA